MATKREQTEPHDGDRRYIRRNSKGRFSDTKKARSSVTGQYVTASQESYRSIGVNNNRGVESSSYVSKNKETKLSLGERLMALRQKIVDSGQPLLSWDEINEEAARRRGKIE